jgi:zinc/manganese transport system ATP-binding protein
MLGLALLSLLQQKCSMMAGLNCCLTSMDKPTDTPSLTFHGLTLGYNRHPAVHHLCGTVQQGSLTAVIGPNGSGKSTLMKGIVGIVPPISGVLTIASGQRIAYLPQLSEVNHNFPARVCDLVALGLWPVLGLLKFFKKSHHQAVCAALAAVGLTGFENRAIDTLSGGQIQRALFARLLLQDADLILLDEPFNAIDTKTVGDLITLIKQWHSEQRTIMVVMHDMALVREHFPHSLLLGRQEIAWGKTDEIATSENLAKARRFTESWNENAPWCDAPGDMGPVHHHECCAHDKGIS